MQDKNILDFAKKLLSLSLDNNVVCEKKVQGVIDQLKQKSPYRLPKVLKCYSRLIKLEIAKYTATVEHSGDLSESTLKDLEKDLSNHYGRTIILETKKNTDLIAGIKISIADDVYEMSVQSRLHPLTQLSV